VFVQVGKGRGACRGNPFIVVFMPMTRPLHHDDAKVMSFVIEGKVSEPGRQMLLGSRRYVGKGS
jgi:hypothetical protein